MDWVEGVFGKVDFPLVLVLVADFVSVFGGCRDGWVGLPMMFTIFIFISVFIIFTSKVWLLVCFGRCGGGSDGDGCRAFMLVWMWQKQKRSAEWCCHGWLILMTRKCRR